MLTFTVVNIVYGDVLILQHVYIYMKHDLFYYDNLFCIMLLLPVYNC